jgi:hypothetical protein
MKLSNNKNHNKPPKWTQVYPQGTQEGDEEQLVFIALARNPKYDWRSTAAIVKESCLTPERVEQILLKYYNIGMVFQNPKNESSWGYWERVEYMLEDVPTITDDDQDERIKKAIKTSNP